ncbi:MAG: hypothetical protein ABS951_15910 [Solibacillus sp.]
MIEKCQEIIKQLHEADAVLIGASNGLSISEGYHIFAEDEAFLTYFREFCEKYGISSIVQGAFFPFPTIEERWAFSSSIYAYFSREKEVSTVMNNLYELLKDKNYFIVTSNTDGHLTSAGFENDRLFEIEGNSNHLQCKHACHDHIYAGEDVLQAMYEQKENGRVRAELIPVCPKCGGEMQVHVEVNPYFLKGEAWQASFQAYQDFIKQAHGKKLVLLELGVGARNQLIKAPFMNLTYLEKNATYITLNKGQVYIPEIISAKSIGVDADLAEVLAQLVQINQK